MTVEQLKELWKLLDLWASEPEWDKTSTAWANIIETKRQVEIDLSQADPQFDLMTLGSI